MASSSVLKVTCLALACMVVSAAKAKAEIACDEVVNSLRPCVIDIAYGETVSDTCCSGIKTLRRLAKTRADRTGVCTCLEQFLDGYPYTDDHVRLGAALPEKCGVNLPYKISPAMDCNGYDWLCHLCVVCNMLVYINACVQNYVLLRMRILCAEYRLHNHTTMVTP